MTEARLPSAKEFRTRFIGLSYWVSAPAFTIVISCLMALLDLTAEQWSWFFSVTIAYAAVAITVQMMIQGRILQPITHLLDLRARGETSLEAQRRAFARLIDLPRVSALMGIAGWVVPVIVVSIGMAIRFEQWGVFQTAVLVLAGFAAGFVAGTFLLFLAKRNVARLRDGLAMEMPDPDERRALVRPMAVRTKLFVTVTGVAVIPVIFAVLLAQATTTRAIDEFVIGWQQGALDAASGDHDTSLAGAAPSAVIASPLGLGATVDVAVLDLDGPVQGALAKRLGPSILDHLRREVVEGAVRGDSAGLPTVEIFAWRKREDGSLLVAATPSRSLAFDTSQMWTVFALLLVVSSGVAFGLAHLLAGDISRATESLRAEAERMASGDLRCGEVMESEDELGELSRSFEGMTRALRETMARVAEAADRVEGTASEMSSVTQSVAAVTVDQVSGIEQTTTSMEAINAQVRGIADSSQALNVSVEESSSSILELGAAGEELNDTASVLSSKVNEVSSSIEQMVRSVRQVSANTDALSEAAVETSASMGEMATSMREVDASAEETAGLSRQVVESAENGQRKMMQTIEGMEAIRDATETAERVIRSLGSRTTEIGAIVDVIDDVADETNLLALNAAIIAAQAGENGRAFSVVADEIKDLADRVLVSTKEIGSLIQAVQAESSNAIGAIERGAVSVASGVDLSAEAGVSLEEITRASRESGQRIAGIVAAVREQAKAAGHVVDLMERVRGGVDEISHATAEQDRGNEVVYGGAVAMRDVAQQVRATTEEQARGSGRIRDSVEGVRSAVEQINSALQEQSAACRSAVELLEGVYNRTRSNEESTQRMDGVSRSLTHQAQALREAVQRFRI